MSRRRGQPDPRISTFDILRHNYYMKQKYHPGDFVACYITNTEVYEELLMWGMVIDVSPTLEDILILDKDGKSHWWPAHRWRPLNYLKKSIDIYGKLA